MDTWHECYENLTSTSSWMLGPTKDSSHLDFAVNAATKDESFHSNLMSNLDAFWRHGLTETEIGTANRLPSVKPPAK